MNINMPYRLRNKNIKWHRAYISFFIDAQFNDRHSFNCAWNFNVVLDAGIRYDPYSACRLNIPELF